MKIVAGVAGIFITRALGPLDKGIYLYLTVILALVTQITAGDAAAIAWQWGKQRLPERAVFSAGALVGGCIAVVAAAILILCALLWHNWFLLVVVAALPFANLSQLCTSFFVTKQRVDLINIQTTFTGTVLPITAAVCAYAFHQKLVAVLVVWLLAQAVVAAFSVRMLSKMFRLVPLVLQRTVLSAHVRFAFQACGQQLLAYLNSKVDLLVVLLVLGTAQLGIYSVAIAGNELLWMFTRALSIAAFSRIASEETEHAAALTARCIRHGLLVASSVAIVGIASAPLIPLVYGTAFSPAVLALRLVLPGAVIWSCMDVLTAFFSTQYGRPVIALSIQSLSALICGSVTLFLAPRLGIAAGALGSSLGYAIGGTLAIILFARTTGTALASILIPRRADLLAYPTLLTRVFRARFATP
ncbi:MAG: hypothetical protein WB609_02485 [Candidatus Cybelea sp.]